LENINDFKATLKGGGARANQFQVTLPFPGFAAVGGETRVMSYLCQATNLPGMTLGEVDVKFRGRSLYIAGDRTFEAWTTTIMNDTDFMLRNAFERWMNEINAMSDNSGLENPSDYMVDGFVDHLDRAGQVIKAYTFRGMWPLTVAPIELTAAEAGEVESFEITYRYQFFETNTTT
jgi:hypothetical protein